MVSLLSPHKDAMTTDELDFLAADIRVPKCPRASAPVYPLKGKGKKRK